MPDEAVDLGQRQPGLGAVGVEQAQLDAFGGLAEHREVGAGAVVGGPERIGLAGPNSSEAACGLAAWVNTHSIR